MQGLHARQLDHFVDIAICNGPSWRNAQNLFHLLNVFCDYLELFAAHIVVALTVGVL